MMKYDIIIIGGGHAGIEAANISAKFNLKVILITDRISNIGIMNCNPSIGGIGKSILVRELDILGGIMGKAADKNNIGANILNRSKGLAVRATRYQIDKVLYSKFIINKLKNYKNLIIIENKVIKILIENNNVKGVITENNNKYFADNIVLASGTFLEYKIIYGNIIQNNNKNNNIYLANQLKEILPGYGRFRTGTPPRLDANTINFNKLKKINYEYDIFPFSISNKYYNNIKEIPCYITKTNYKVHNIVIKNIKNSIIYSGKINSKGPKHCISLEDKISKFSNIKEHRIILEKESITNNIIYPNGIPMSYTKYKQQKIINHIKGLEKAKIIKPGYIIEYGYFNPKYLNKKMESKNIKGLYLAGQINGTSGYEEAAAQGIIVGINIYNKITKKNIILDSRISYITTLINDIVSNGVTEPYRIFTSRNKNNLILREDNCDIRIYNAVKKIKRYKRIAIQIKKKINYLKKEIIKLKKNKIIYLGIKNKKYSFINIYKGNKYNIFLLSNLVDSSIIYKDYIKRNIKAFKKIDKKLYIPNNINYKNINISKRTLKNINRFKPRILNDIYKIPGHTPYEILNIFNYIKKNF